MFRWK